MAVSEEIEARTWVESPAVRVVDPDRGPYWRGRPRPKASADRSSPESPERHPWMDNCQRAEGSDKDSRELLFSEVNGPSWHRPNFRWVGPRPEGGEVNPPRVSLCPLVGYASLHPPYIGPFVRLWTIPPSSRRPVFQYGHGRRTCQPQRVPARQSVRMSSSRRATVRRAQPSRAAISSTV